MMIMMQQHSPITHILPSWQQANTSLLKVNAYIFLPLTTILILYDKVQHFRFMSDSVEFFRLFWKENKKEIIFFKFYVVLN